MTISQPDALSTISSPPTIAHGTVAVLCPFGSLGMQSARMDTS